MNIVTLTLNKRLANRLTILVSEQGLTLEQLIEIAIDNLEAMLKHNIVDNEDVWGNLIREVNHMRDKDYSR